MFKYDNGLATKQYAQTKSGNNYETASTVLRTHIHTRNHQYLLSTRSSARSNNMQWASMPWTTWHHYTRCIHTNKRPCCVRQFSVYEYHELKLKGERMVSRSCLLLHALKHTHLNTPQLCVVVTYTKRAHTNENCTCFLIVFICKCVIIVYKRLVKRLIDLINLTP